ncbi:MAG: hydrogenase maturation protease [Candidatus Thermoplasmatota archaeon]|nr:hydrogenase maturation protease [Candidatus Thermoplasmatota archaeon]
MKTMVLGVGNPILQDDSIGLHVAQYVKERIDDPTVHVDVAYTGGLNLLDVVQGYDSVILIDAIRDTTKKNGTVERLPLPEGKTVYSCNPHDVSFAEAMTLARNLGVESCPHTIVIIGIVVNQTPEFGEELSTEIERAVPVAAQLVLTELKRGKSQP